MYNKDTNGQAALDNEVDASSLSSDSQLDTVRTPEAPNKEVKPPIQTQNVIMPGGVCLPFPVCSFQSSPANQAAMIE